jgi:hypothetical protein
MKNRLSDGFRGYQPAVHLSAELNGFPRQDPLDFANILPPVHLDDQNAPGV